MQQNKGEGRRRREGGESLGTHYAERPQDYMWLTTLATGKSRTNTCDLAHKTHSKHHYGNEQNPIVKLFHSPEAPTDPYTALPPPLRNSNHASCHTPIRIHPHRRLLIV